MPDEVLDGTGLTREQKRLGGRMGAEARKRTLARRKADPLWAVKVDLPGHMAELKKAAYGQGSWSDLPATSRLQALMSLIAYGAGRPVSLDKTLPKDVSSEGGGVEAPATLSFE